MNSLYLLYNFIFEAMFQFHFFCHFPSLEFLKSTLKKHSLKLVVLEDKITGFVFDLSILPLFPPSGGKLVEQNENRRLLRNFNVDLNFVIR